MFLSNNHVYYSDDMSRFDYDLTLIRTIGSAEISLQW